MNIGDSIPTGVYFFTPGFLRAVLLVSCCCWLWAGALGFSNNRGAFTQRFWETVKPESESSCARLASSVRLKSVEQEKKFAVIEVPDLKLPFAFDVPSKRFRLFVAADTTNVNTQAISDFALPALERGMVYFCSWGPGCERFHDIVDEVIVGDDLSEQEFSGPSTDDVIMTTWHDDETLEEALDYFAICTTPTDGFAADSDFRLVICVGNSDWAARANKFLHSATFFDLS